MPRVSVGRATGRLAHLASYSHNETHPIRGADGLVRPEPDSATPAFKTQGVLPAGRARRAEHRRGVPVLAGAAGAGRAGVLLKRRAPEALWFVAVAIAGFAPALFMLSTWPHIPRWYALRVPGGLHPGRGGRACASRAGCVARAGTARAQVARGGRWWCVPGHRPGQPGRARRDAADGAAAVPADALVVPVVAVASPAARGETSARPRPGWGWRRGGTRAWDGVRWLLGAAGRAIARPWSWPRC